MLLHIPAMFSDVWSKIEGVIPEHRNGSGKYFWTITDWTDSIAVYYIYIYIYIIYIISIRLHHVQTYTRAILPHAALSLQQKLI